MDPRHPEQAISRMRELMKQYDRIESDMAKATTSAQLAQLEREGGLVVQEICLVAPRIHEAMMQASRQRRHDLSRGNVYEQMRTYAATAEVVEEPEVVGDNSTIIAVDEYTTEEAEVVEKPAEKPVVIEKLVETELDKEVNEALKPLEKPKKKVTRKKKTTKKKEGK